MNKGISTWEIDEKEEGSGQTNDKCGGNEVKEEGIGDVGRPYRFDERRYESVNDNECAPSNDVIEDSTGYNPFLFEFEYKCKAINNGCHCNLTWP